MKCKISCGFGDVIDNYIYNDQESIRNNDDSLYTVILTQ